MKPSLILPAFQPTGVLADLVDRLLSAGAEDIIVVDDGSRAETSRAVFDTLEGRQGVRLFRHAVNLGKGRALKTAFNAYLLGRDPASPGVVTLDADGQHLPEDVMSTATALQKDNDALHLGVRTFGADVPWRSRLGNQATRAVFGVVTNVWVRDTQTGLRGIPASLVPHLLDVQGERYEYETGVLLRTNELGWKIREHPIATVYIGNNEGSHFNPVMDSMRVYFVFCRFLFSSALASIVDWLIFSLAYFGLGSIGWGMFWGRLVSSAVNFSINRTLVFRSPVAFGIAALRYYALVTILGGTSYLLIRWSSSHWDWPVLLAKAVAEAFLFLASYSLQSALVFRAPNRETGAA